MAWNADYSSVGSRWVVGITDPPAAAFSADVTTGTAPLTVTFTDESLNTPTTWLWEKSDDAGETWADFDGTPTAQNPEEDFAEGTWSVRLTATNVAGPNVKTELNYIVVDPA